MGKAEITVQVFDCSTRIGVCIERCGWAHSFEIKLEDGLLPKRYQRDRAIMAAYKQVQDAADKWRHKVFCRDNGDTAPD